MGNSNRSTLRSRFPFSSCFLENAAFDPALIKLLILCRHRLRSAGQILTGISVLSGGIALIVIIAFLRRYPYKSKKLDVEIKSKKRSPEIRCFSLEELREATRNFHSSNLLGQGGFGSVYKGTLPDGQTIAIKKLADSNSHGSRSFLAELETITNAQHTNLIRLLRWCLHGTDKYLVYEYMRRQSLDKHIFEAEGERTSTLTWINRKVIILGTAKGLKYLHHESQVSIIHRDIKAANILLDEKLEPKIADFGLARLVSPSQAHVTATFAFTRGYVPPEYVMYGHLTAKYDVYSFGVVVLEILSGRKALDNRLAAEDQLVKWAWVQYENGTFKDLMDPQLQGQYKEEDAHRLIKLALACTQTEPSLRPEMSNVVAYLENKRKTIANPRKPEIEATNLLKTLETPSKESGSHFANFSTSNTSSSASHLLHHSSTE